MSRFDINELRERVGLPNYRQEVTAHMHYHRLYEKVPFSYPINNKPFHLFFLLEGEIYLKHKNGIVRMSGPKFFCTAEKPQVYNAHQDACFITIDFDKSTHRKNQQFIDWLITNTNSDNKVYSPLVIQDGLLAALNNIVKELCDGYDYLNIHETLTILLRLLYKTERFSPISLGEYKDKQIQTTPCLPS